MQRVQREQKKLWWETKMNHPTLGKLRKLAEGATPGPWTPSDHNGPQWKISGPRGEFHVIATTSQGNDEPNAAFIAAANPQTVLQLLDRVERLERTMGMALNAVSVDAVECVGATKTKQYFITEWAMNRVREALRELGEG